MKLSTSFALLAILPLLPQVFATVVPRQGNQRNRGGNNNGANNNAGGNNNNAGANNNTGANNDNADPQTSLTLDPRVIAEGFANDGQDVPADGQVASLTSTNNFINHCLTVPDLPLTNGKQITTGSCNPAPIGVIPSVDNMPSSKFTNPKNGDTIPSDEAFTITMAIKNLQTGAFVNAQENYFSAPQQVSNQGTIIGHSHVVVEELDALDQATPTDPKKFAFFKGLNAAATNGVLSADVTAGVPAGAYRLCSINAAANHQPVIVPIAQHGSLDDCVYFTATPGGAQANGGNNGGNNDNANNDNNGGAAGNNDDNAGADDAAGDNGGGAGADGAAGNNGDNTGADDAASDTSDGTGADNTGAGDTAGGNGGGNGAGGAAGANGGGTGAGGAGGGNNGGRGGRQGGRGGRGGRRRGRFAREE